MRTITDALQEMSKPFSTIGELQAGGLFASVFIAMIMGFVLSKIYKLYFGSSEPTDYGIGNSFLLMMPAVAATKGRVIPNVKRLPPAMSLSEVCWIFLAAFSNSGEALSFARSTMVRD